ncbi:MAG: hypothetical protein K2O97_14765 [Acetatifactor sp.]|nr:hypothetical protein [Acetatifactor sp.]MDE7046233.1 hypothetical protein [Acetatifactor sp.]
MDNSYSKVLQMVRYVDSAAAVQNTQQVSDWYADCKNMVQKNLSESLREKSGFCQIMQQKNEGIGKAGF